MRDAVLRARGGAAAVFMAAAVSDYVPQAARSKIKRDGAALTLALLTVPVVVAGRGELQIAGAVARLSRMTADTDTEVKLASVWALGQIGSPESRRVPPGQPDRARRSAPRRPAGQAPG